ncbi:MAG: alpha/beta hydrolase [Chloroflexi bacterium]|nr:alpha/beta hydrolase [Chloroflexota bacterium]
MTAMVAVRPRKRRWLRWVAAIVGLVLLVAVVVGAWFVQPQPNLTEASAAMISTPQVVVSQDRGWIEFRPTASEPATAFIFYPGGKVEPAAYARSAQVIAEAGYLVAVVPMPLNLAVLGANKADDVIAAYPDIQHWAIGGHSLGGAMAGQYARCQPAIEGLALWAAFPNGDVAGRDDIEALSIWGFLDGGAERFGSDATKATLPPDTRYVVIDGGNHEQMGDYTGQPNDPLATITRDEQQAQVQQATIEMLAIIDTRPSRAPSAGATVQLPGC